MADNRVREEDDDDMEEMLQVQNTIYCLYLMEEEVEDELVLTALGAMAWDVRNEHIEYFDIHITVNFPLHMISTPMLFLSLYILAFLFCSFHFSHLL
jgi:hypothetical protein